MGKMSPMLSNLIVIILDPELAQAILRVMGQERVSSIEEMNTVESIEWKSNFNLQDYIVDRGNIKTHV